MFFSSDSQNWFFEALSIRVLETLPLLPPAVPVAPVPLDPLALWVPVAIWLLVDTVPVTLRDIFT